MHSVSHSRAAAPARLARRAAGVRGATGAAVAAAAVAGALALSTGVAQAAPVAGHQAGAAVSYTFTTLDDQADPTFNQLLGINAHNVIAGYFGSGAAGHPNKGYLLGCPAAPEPKYPAITLWALMPSNWLNVGSAWSSR